MRAANISIFLTYFRKENVPFPHELSLHFVKLKTNCSPFVTPPGFKMEKEKEIVIQCKCELSKLHRRHLQCELRKASWKKPQQAEFDSGQHISTRV